MKTLPRNEWIPCPICGSEYDGVFCHACRNEAASSPAQGTPEPPAKWPDYLPATGMGAVALIMNFWVRTFVSSPDAEQIKVAANIIESLINHKVALAGQGWAVALKEWFTKFMPAGTAVLDPEKFADFLVSMVQHNGDDLALVSSDFLAAPPTGDAPQSASRYGHPHKPQEKCSICEPSATGAAPQKEKP